MAYMAHQVRSTNPGQLEGISAQTNDIHHGKLYAGYVAKRNEIEDALREADVSTANQVYSAWRGLKEGETFAANGMILHEHYFAVLGGDGISEGLEVRQAITEQWGSWERFEAEFVATALAARGWAVLAYDFSDSRLHIYSGDAQNQGGVWGSVPLLPCDVYEHAYFLDFGSDRKSYVLAFLKNVRWGRVEEMYQKYRTIS
jgi:superoxide dismutase, Fe-Mn family